MEKVREGNYEGTAAAKAIACDQLEFFDQT